MVLYMTIDQLNHTFSALADPTRRAILCHLSKGEARVSELAKPFMNVMSLPAITKHLQVLERAGLISKTKDAQRRPCTLNAETLKDAADWIAQYRTFWEASFDRLEEYLETVDKSPSKGTKNVSSKKRK